MQRLVLTAVGPDRPGLVDHLTRELGKFDCNIADSRMVNLRGQFAIVMLVQMPDDQADPLTAAMGQAGQAVGLRIEVAQSRGDQATRAGVPYRIRTYAMDQAGLVHQIAHVLNEHRVNIEDLTSCLDHGPHTGTPLFSLDMIVTVPPGVKLADVRSELEALCAKLNCDLDIDPA